MQHCDFARFAPGGDRAVDLAQTATRLAAVVARLDASLHPQRQAAGTTRSAALVLVVGGVAALLWLCPCPARAATLDDAFSAANRLYVQGNYPKARAAYEALLTHGIPSPAIQYNLGNTLVREKRLGEAVGHYKQALRLDPDPRLRADVSHNLGAVRGQLADQARRRHATLHIFDESPELDVAVARAAPRTWLAILGLIGGFGALALVGLALFGPARWRRRSLALGGGAATLGLVHAVSLGWLWHAQRVDAQVQHAIVVEEDAALAPCQGVAETIGLPEGLEVRRVAELPDGRVEVRLPNGRQGCVAPDALYLER